MMRLRRRPSPNRTERRGGVPVDLLILHYTEMRDAAAALDRLCDPDTAVSAHYLVDLDGTVWALVDEGDRAWHAGVAFWDGETDINSRSVGVEVQNRGPGQETDPFPQPQMAALAALCRDIVGRRAIPAWRVLGHSDVAVGRKIDPGPEFPWAWLAAEGVGVWLDAALPAAPDTERAIALLLRIGYLVDAVDAALRAFRLHWVPEVAEEAPLDPVTMGRLEDLARRVAGS